MEFYTYIHIRGDTGMVFYVGKGKEDRAYWAYGRNNHWTNIVRKAGGFDVDILAYWATESDAFDHEVALIAAFRDLGIPLANKTNGGEGCSGWKPTPEQRARMREARRGIKASPETRRKMSETQRKLQAQPERRERVRAQSIAYWENPECRERHARITQSEEHRKKLSVASREKLTRPGFLEGMRASMSAVWDRPGFREKMSEQRREAMRNDDQFRVRLLNQVRKIAESPEIRAKMSDSAKRRWSSEEARAALGALSRAHWQKPGVKEAASKRVLCVDTGEVFESINEASRRMGVNQGQISEVCNCKGGRRRAGGYVFRFVETTPDLAC